MAVHRWLPGVLAVVVSLASPPARSQSSEIFKGRLSSLPVDAITAPTMTGTGSVTATLQNGTLIVSGEFKGLGSPAAAAHVHRAQPGLRGPVAFDLTVTKADTGTIEGRLPLNAGQLNDLKCGWYYIQIHTEKHPEGHLRGWLLR